MSRRFPVGIDQLEFHENEAGAELDAVDAGVEQRLTDALQNLAAVLDLHVEEDEGDLAFGCDFFDVLLNQDVTALQQAIRRG